MRKILSIILAFAMIMSLFFVIPAPAATSDVEPYFYEDFEDWTAAGNGTITASPGNDYGSITPNGPSSTIWTGFGGSKYSYYHYQQVNKATYWQIRMNNNVADLITDGGGGIRVSFWIKLDTGTCTLNTANANANAINITFMCDSPGFSYQNLGNISVDAAKLNEGNWVKITKDFSWGGSLRNGTNIADIADGVDFYADFRFGELSAGNLPADVLATGSFLAYFIDDFKIEPYNGYGVEAGSKSDATVSGVSHTGDVKSSGTVNVNFTPAAGATLVNILSKSGNDYARLASIKVPAGTTTAAYTIPASSSGMELVAEIYPSDETGKYGTPYLYEIGTVAAPPAAPAVKPYFYEDFEGWVASDTGAITSTTTDYYGRVEPVGGLSKLGAGFAGSNKAYYHYQPVGSLDYFNVHINKNAGDIIDAGGGGIRISFWMKLNTATCTLNTEDGNAKKINITFTQNSPFAYQNLGDITVDPATLNTGNWVKISKDYSWNGILTRSNTVDIRDLTEGSEFSAQLRFGHTGGDVISNTMLSEGATGLGYYIDEFKIEPYTGFGTVPGSKSDATVTTASHTGEVREAKTINISFTPSNSCNTIINILSKSGANYARLESIDVAEGTTTLDYTIPATAVGKTIAVEIYATDASTGQCGAPYVYDIGIVKKELDVTMTLTGFELGVGITANVTVENYKSDESDVYGVLLIALYDSDHQLVKVEQKGVTAVNGAIKEDSCTATPVLDTVERPHLADTSVAYANAFFWECEKPAGAGSDWEPSIYNSNLKELAETKTQAR